MNPKFIKMIFKECRVFIHVNIFICALNIHINHLMARSLGEEMATHSNIFAWEITWTEEPGGLQSWGCKRVEYDLAIKQQKQYIIN